MTSALGADEQAPVLITGGGLVGLSTAMFLAQQGIASIALERLRGGSPVPRAAHFHMRTLELFRQAGIEDEVKRTSEEEFLPEGAIIAMDSLAGRKLADIISSLNAGVEAVSPCRRLFITQPGLEPILRRRARQAGATVLEGHELVDFDQDASGVTVRARDVDTGHERTLRGAYLVGADGAHSRVREVLGIPVDGRGIFSNSITIYFEADLTPQMLGKPISGRAGPAGENHRAGSLAGHFRRGQAIPGWACVSGRRLRAPHAAQWRFRRQHRYSRRA